MELLCTDIAAWNFLISLLLSGAASSYLLKVAGTVTEIHTGLSVCYLSSVVSDCYVLPACNFWSSWNACCCCELGSLWRVVMHALSTFGAELTLLCAIWNRQKTEQGLWLCALVLELVWSLLTSLSPSICPRVQVPRSGACAADYCAADYCGCWLAQSPASRGGGACTACYGCCAQVLAWRVTTYAIATIYFAEWRVATSAIAAISDFANLNCLLIG